MVRHGLAAALSLALSSCSSSNAAPGREVVQESEQPDASVSEHDAGAPPIEQPTESPNRCIDVVSAGDHVYTCDGFTFDVRTPAACAAGGCGIILDVHGFTMSAAIEDVNTNLRAIGEREGYVVVQPNAKGTPPTSGWKPEDYDAVWSFFMSAQAALRTDPKRVHVTGFSQGGQMTWAFVCRHADVIASAAPSALSGCTEPELAAVKRRLPVLYMHGKRDVIASFEKFAVPQRDAIIAAWQLEPPVTIASDALYTRSRWVGPGGAVFEMLVHDYAAAAQVLAGHCFPGSTDGDVIPGQLFSFACKPPNAFVWGEEVIAFFKAHPMP